jgi:peroxin-6
VSGTVLLHGGEGVGKFTLVSRAAAALGLHVAMIDGSDLALQGLREAEETLRNLASAAADAAPAVLVIRHADEFMAGEGQGSETDGDSRGSTVVRVLEEAVQRQLQATTNKPGKGNGVLCVAICIKDVADVPVTVRSWCTHEIEVKVPSTECRKDLLSQLVPPNLRSHPCIGKLAERTAALTPRDLCALASDATTVAIGRALEKGHGMSMSMVQPQDLEEALARQNALRAASAIGGAAPSIPDIKWDDVGGLEDVKRSLLDTIELPLKCPHLFASGVKRRSGVLLYGPPGTGKTLLAKAVASQCGLNFLSVKGPELINSYVGESERNVRELFSKARAASPCVVFFDEIDALAPARGKAGDSGGVMDRITSQLLAEIDGAAAGSAADEDDSEGPVFIMGATNRPDLVDSALLRPGRFDALLYVYVPKGTEPAMKVLKALTRKMTLEEGLVDKLPMLMEEHILKRHKGAALTGADMYGWASAAYLAALKRTVTELIDNGYVAGSLPDGEAPPVVVSAADWIEAGLGVRPSVSEAEIQDYEGMRQRYSNTGGGGSGAATSRGGETDNPSARSTRNQQALTPPKPGFDPSKAAAAYAAGRGNGGLPGLATNSHAQTSNPSFPPQRPSPSPSRSPGSPKQRRMGSGLGGGSGIPGLGN